MADFVSCSCSFGEIFHIISWRPSPVYGRRPFWEILDLPLIICIGFMCSCGKTERVPVADLRGPRRTPIWPKLFSISCSFGKIWQNRMLAPHPRGLEPPPTGNPGSAHEFLWVRSGRTLMNYRHRQSFFMSKQTRFALSYLANDTIFYATKRRFINNRWSYKTICLIKTYSISKFENNFAMESFLNVSLNSMTKIFVITVKGLEPSALYIGALIA